MASADAWELLQRVYECAPSDASAVKAYGLGRFASALRVTAADRSARVSLSLRRPAGRSMPIPALGANP